MAERWLPIKGYDGIYEVSDLGRVRSYRVRGKRHKFLAEPRILMPKRLRNGRRAAGLRFGECRTFHLIYRLVLEAFVGPCPEGMEACHWDGKRDNDRLSNLRWDTHAANFEDARRHGTLLGLKAGVKHHNARLTDDDIRCIRAEPVFVGVNGMLARAFGVKPAHISSIRNGRKWGHVEQHLCLTT